MGVETCANGLRVAWCVKACPCPAKMLILAGVTSVPYFSYLMLKLAAHPST